MTFQTTSVVIPPSAPRVQLVVRIIDGAPVLFTSDGKFVMGQRRLDISAPLEGVLTVHAEFYVGPSQCGLPLDH